MPSITRSASPREALQAFAGRLRGKIVVKGTSKEEEYKNAIARWNMMHVKEANIIVFPESEHDVSEAIKFVKEYNLDVAVSGGRHTYSGASSGYGLVIDLRNLRNVSVNVEAKTLTAGGGCLAKDVEEAAEAAGFRIVMGTINETGIGGITTGGGIGPLSGQYGLVCDNLLSARVALADGTVVNASELENSDLFWAIRGAGGNFGICTELTYKLHQSRGLIYTAMIPFPRASLRECVTVANALYADQIPASRGRLGVQLVLLALMTPDPAIAWLVHFDGSREEARRLLEPIFALDPLIQAVEHIVPYPETTSFEPYKPFFGDSDRFVASSVQMPYPLDHDIIELFATEYERVRSTKDGKAKSSMLTFDLRWYKTVAEVTVNKMAYAQRVEGCIGYMDMAWHDPGIDEVMVRETKEVLEKVRKMLKDKRRQRNGNGKENRTVVIHDELDKGPKTVPNGHGDSATNHAKGSATAKAEMEDEDDEPISQLGATTLYALLSDGKEKMMSVFGSNLPRLRQLKRKYDPDCIWNKWYPIEPAEAG